MPKKSTSKLSSQRKLNFDDSVGQSNITKQDEDVKPRSQKRAGPTMSFSSTKSCDQQNIERYASPQKKLKTGADTVNVVTPDVLETTKRAVSLQTHSSNYIPSYIHKNVEYVRKGHILKVSPIQSKVLQWINDNYEIPDDFEQNRKFGPLSGSSYVDRVMTAYRLGTLQRNEVSDEDDKTRKDITICTMCADLGHIADTCPTLL